MKYICFSEIFSYSFVFRFHPLPWLTRFILLRRRYFISAPATIQHRYLFLVFGSNVTSKSLTFFVRYRYFICTIFISRKASDLRWRAYSFWYYLSNNCILNLSFQRGIVSVTLWSLYFSLFQYHTSFSVLCIIVAFKLSFLSFGQEQKCTSRKYLNTHVFIFSIMDIFFCQTHYISISCHQLPDFLI